MFSKTQNLCFLIQYNNNFVKYILPIAKRTLTQAENFHKNAAGIFILMYVLTEKYIYITQNIYILIFFLIRLIHSYNT